MDPRHKRKKEIICKCNGITRAEIETAIRGGCRTLNEIFDQTTAGVGACGGSCRRYLKPLLEAYLRDGAFPDTLVPDNSDKLRRSSD